MGGEERSVTHRPQASQPILPFVIYVYKTYNGLILKLIPRATMTL